MRATAPPFPETSAVLPRRTPIRLDEDWHVHSTFSDGVDSLEANIARAAELGLRRLGCVDHVRHDTTYVPAFVSAVRDAQARTGIALTAGIEAKMLDQAGTLDLPDSAEGVDVVYIADHQVPGDTGPVSPRAIREAIARGEEDGAGVASRLASALVNAIRRNAPRHRLVLAHPFSLLPKLGLDEAILSDASIDAVARAAAASRTIVEVSERWRCPSARVLRACLANGVTLVASTDSHRAADIGMYHYVAARADELADVTEPHD